jgi:hypothetical protein
LFRYIWDVDRRSLARATTSRRTSSNYYYGPKDVEAGRIEFRRALDVFQSIRDTGYRPEEHSPITGFFIGDDEVFRFVIGSGNHRAAALAALGVPAAEVVLHSHPAYVHVDQLGLWCHDKGGLFSPQTAALLHDVYVRGSGQDVAQWLGL